MNDLALLDSLNGISTQLGTDDNFNELSKSDFLGRLQLFTKGKAVDKGHIPPGNYGIPETGDQIINLGKSIDILPLARKPKAVDMSDRDAIIVSYDANSTEFQRIQAAAQGKESNCMYGPTFLVYERTSGRFLEFFCGNKSSRNEAAKLYPNLPLTAKDIAERGLDGQEPHWAIPATLTSEYVEKGAFSWHVPVVGPCSTPFPGFDSARAIKEIQRFINTKSDGVEKVEETAGKKQRAR